MKGTMLGIFCAAAGMAFGADVVRVECHSDKKETVVAAAWSKAAKVSDVVEAEDLVPGAKVYRWDGKAWACWELEAKKTWKSCEAGKREKPAAGGGLAKGTSFVLVREKGLGKPFTVDVPSNAKGVVVEKGTEDDDAATLVAGPLDTDFDFNNRGVSEWQSAGATARDVVRIRHDDDWREVGFKASGVTVDTTGWGVLAKEEGDEFEKGAVVPKETAFWYVSRGGDAAPAWDW